MMNFLLRSNKYPSNVKAFKIIISEVDKNDFKSICTIE